MATAERYPLVLVQIIDEADTVLHDLTLYVRAIKISVTDQIQAGTCTLTLANPNGYFDTISGQAGSSLLANNTKIRVYEGEFDPVTKAVASITAAFTGYVTRKSGSYVRTSESMLDVTLLDGWKFLVTSPITTILYTNTQVNRIAADILARYGKVNPASISLDAAIDYVLNVAQFPGYTVADALSALYDPIMHAVQYGYDGVWRTVQKLGSGTGALILGYPDALTPPSSGLVALTLPDGATVEEVDYTDTDMEYKNQAIVNGKAASTVETVGPQQALFKISPTAIGANSGFQNQYFYGNSSGSQNLQLARNIVIQITAADNIAFNSSTTFTIYCNNQGVYPLAANHFNLKDLINSGQPNGILDFNNTDGQRIGYIYILAVTDTFITLRFWGVQFSSGGGLGTREHGGWFFALTCLGEPVTSSSSYLTQYVDYQTIDVTFEDVSSSMPFNDGVTYQVSNFPIAMGTPVAVKIDGTVIGTSSLNVSDNPANNASTNQFKVNYQAGQISLTMRQYAAWAAESLETDGPGFPNSTTGGANTITNSVAWDTSILAFPAPVQVYQSSHIGDVFYHLVGLQAGLGYIVRLHLGDAWSTAPQQRIFTVYANGVAILKDLDIYAELGGGTQPASGSAVATVLTSAYTTDIEGVQSDVSGNMSLFFGVHDPTTGIVDPIHDSGSSSFISSASAVPAIISGFEIIDPTTNQIIYAINCGGPAITPALPVVKISYGHSPAQKTYGIQAVEINNPLLSTDLQLLNCGQYAVNYQAWQRYSHKIRMASEPGLYPGKIIKYYNPVTNADMWVYVASIDKVIIRDSVGLSQANPNQHTLNTFLLYRSFR